MKPKISVITIAFNSASSIEETIKSVIGQKYENLEYIIIDGGSTDGTVDIIKKYEQYVAYWISEPDKGISDAFNKGINAATGDVIGIVNSDDQYLEGALAAVADSYDGVADVYRGSILINDKEKYTYAPSMKFGVLPIKVNVCHLPTFITKAAYEKYGGYDTSYKIAMDLDLLRRFYRKGAKFKLVDAVLGNFNVGGVSTSTDIAIVFKERERVILKNGGTFVHVLVYRGYRYFVALFKWITENVLNIRYNKIRYKQNER